MPHVTLSREGDRTWSRSYSDSRPSARAPEPGSGHRWVRTGDPRPTVLVIEDDTWLRSLLSDLLPAEGYAFEEASNGAAGVRLAKEHRPDAVLLDLAMPEVSGDEVLRALKSDRSTADIPIIVASAYAGRLRGSEIRYTEGVIQKPFDLGDLVAHIERCRDWRGRPGGQAGGRGHARSATPAEQLAAAGIDATHIVKAVRRVVGIA